jgi:hypothetical protein
VKERVKWHFSLPFSSFCFFSPSNLPFFLCLVLLSFRCFLFIFFLFFSILFCTSSLRSPFIPSLRVPCLFFLFFYFTSSCFRFSTLICFFLPTQLPSPLCLLFRRRFWTLYSCRHQTSLGSNTIHYCLRFPADDWFLLSRRKAIRVGVIRIATCLTHARC